VADEKGYNVVIMCILMNRWIRKHLEMLSNGTIDGFCQCLKKQKIGEYNHFQRLLMIL
jgi:hypothetical protein